MALDLFICYAQEDMTFKDTCLKQLAQLEEGLVVPWHDRLIEVGADWEPAILKALHQCNTVLFLVSPAFLASKFIRSVELPRILARREKGEVRVLPVLIRPCLWKRGPLEAIQAYPRDGQYISQLTPDKADLAWMEVVEQLAAWADSLSPKPLDHGQGNPYRVVILSGHSLQTPLPEAVTMFLAVAREWRNAPLQIELRLDLALPENFLRQSEAGWNLLIFYGHGTKDGRLQMADGSLVKLKKLRINAEAWNHLDAFVLFACHGAQFAETLSCPWIAFTGAILREAPKGFMTAWIRALQKQNLQVAAQQALQTVKSAMKSKFPDLLRDSSTAPISRPLPTRSIPSGNSMVTHLCANMDEQKLFHHEFDATQQPSIYSDHDPFVGRRPLLEQILSLPSPYGDEQLQRMFWVHGAAGMGKTSLLRQCAMLASETIFFDHTEPLFIFHMACSRITSLSELREKLFKGMGEFYRLPSLPTDPQDLCRKLQTKQGTHLWILDDITYIADQAKQPGENPSYHSDDAKNFLQSLLDAARNLTLPLQLVVSSRRKPEEYGRWKLLEVLPFSLAEAQELANRMLVDADMTSMMDPMGASRLFTSVRGSTGLYKRCIALAIKKNMSFSEYANDLERYGIKNAPQDVLELAKYMIRFEMVQQFPAIAQQIGFDINQFLKILHPLVLRCGEFTYDELIEWFGDKFRIKNFSHTILPRLYQDGLEWLVQCSFLTRKSRQGQSVYAMPPNQRIPLASISNPKEVLPSMIPWRGVEERIAQAMELVNVNLLSGLAAFQALEQDYEQYHMETPQAARAVFSAMLLQAEVIGWSNHEATIPIYDAILQKYDKINFKTSPDEVLLVAKVTEAFFNKGVMLGTLNRSDEAIAVYDTLVARHGDRSETAIVEQVAQAIYNKGVRLGALNRSEEEIAVYDALVARHGDRSETAIVELVASAIYNKGVKLGALNRSEESIAIYDALVALHGDRYETAIVELVAKALFNKGISLGALNRYEEAIAVYDALVARFEDRSETAIVEQVAKALLNKGVTLGALNRSEEEIAVYDALVARHGDRSETAIVEKVASALINKGVRLAALNRYKEEVTVYDALVARHGDRSETTIVKRVAKALFNKGVTLAMIGQWDQAQQTMDELFHRYGQHEAPAIQAIMQTGEQVKMWIAENRPQA
ncbi:MAG: TIR domain-containing protein [Magnetococcus sp. YQC-5]